MKKPKIKIEPVDVWVLEPIKNFINNSTAGGIVLFASALLAIGLANSPLAEEYHQFWKIHFGFHIGSFEIDKSLHHWINDGLMAIFFFVVGLELKREIIGGELSNPKNAILPIAAAIGGMIVPAVFYLFFNIGTPQADGWGIPMATDIAFALGVLYLLGDKVPISLKVFLTALAIADDIGAVLVIAFFYTSDIHIMSLVAGAVFMGILIFSNWIGLRSSLYYALFGIGGLWLAFLLSGVHATIAAVLAAFTIPASTKIDEKNYSNHLKNLIYQFQMAKPNKVSTVTPSQLHILEEVNDYTKKALTPLQRLEHNMHPLVVFFIMPIFALCNGGLSFPNDFIDQLLSPVALGVFVGLFVGKFVGVVGMVFLILKLKWAVLPKELNKTHIVGVGFLTAIGFTMSLFIAELAFTQPEYIAQAKLGILTASVLASIVGYFVIQKASVST